MRRLAWGALIIIGSIIVVALVWFVMKEPNVDEPIPNDIDRQVPEVVKDRPTERHAPESPPGDADGDGLSDEEEEEAGTSSTSADTDRDGITDKDEIEKWQTDPTKKDTDGDGFSDLQEIFNGYNPRGDGPLQ